MTSVINGGGLSYQPTNFTRIELSVLRRDILDTRKELGSVKNTLTGELQTIKKQLGDLETKISEMAKTLSSKNSNS